MARKYLYIFWTNSIDISSQKLEAKSRSCPKYT